MSLWFAFGEPYARVVNEIHEALPPVLDVLDRRRESGSEVTRGLAWSVVRFDSR